MAYLYKVTISKKQGGVNQQLPGEIKFPFFSGHFNKQHSCHPWLFFDASGIITTQDFGIAHRKISNGPKGFSIPLPGAAPGFKQLMVQNISIHSRKTNF